MPSRSKGVAKCRMLPCGLEKLCARELSVRLGCEILDVNGSTVKYGTARDQTTADRLGLADRKYRGHSTVACHFPHDVTLDAVNLSILRAAKPRRVFCDGIQHGLDIRRRAGNDA